MPNSQEYSTRFLLDLFSGVHQFGVDVIKAALYKKTANIGASTAYYTASGEVSGLNYIAGGIVVDTQTAPKMAGKVVYWTPSSDIIYPNVTLSTFFDAVLLYNSSKSNLSLGVWTFSEASVAGTDFILKMPSNTPTAALIRVKKVV